MDIPSDRALEQIALRQARRRRFNERLAAMDPDAEIARFRCECGLIACGMALRLTADEYAEVRADARQFAVHGEHVLAETDRIVATHAGWVSIAPAARQLQHGSARPRVEDAVEARVEGHR